MADSATTMSVDRTIGERLRQRRERLQISIGAVCNNNCLFCMEEDRDDRERHNSAMTGERVRWMLETYRDAEEVCFTSGEPTTRSELPTYVAWAKELGFSRISVITNGRRLSHLPYAAALARAGVGRFYVSVHGHAASVHDGLTRTPGSFEQTVAGLTSVARLKGRGVELHSSTVVTKRNLGALGEIYRFLRGRGVDQVVFNVLQANGRADTHFDALFPPYAEIVARFVALLRGLDEPRAPVFLVDAPLCTTEAVPDEHRGFVERYRNFYLDGGHGLHADAEGHVTEGKPRGLVVLTGQDLADAARAKRAECARCRYDALCDGVWTNYVRRYGWGELAPVVDAAAQKAR